jgi:hypothetical protein
MPRTPITTRAPTYRQTMDSLAATHLTVIRLLELTTEMQDQLRLLSDSLAAIVRRDDGRSR